MPESPDPNSTPLDALHRELGARMVSYAGFAMPVRYGGIIAEHRHTRAQASLFDVSHMGQAILRGTDAAEILESLAPVDVQSVPMGHTRYTVLTNDHGGIIDDLIVTVGGDHLFLVVNGGRRGVDFDHLRAHTGPGCALEVRSEHALLALQGPAAGEVLARFAPASRHMVHMNGESLTVADAPCFVTRSGYTGEDGFEMSVPAADAERLARLLLDEPEVKPAGLGARDSLRLEAGLCLYGNDIDETTTPVEAGLAWIIGKRRRAEGGYPGASVITRQLAEGVTRKRVGLRPEGRALARANTEITDTDGRRIGTVTSGGYGPSAGGPVAMGYVDPAHADAGTPVRLIVRGKALAGRVQALPFVAHRYKK